jgi:DNA-binding NarL/FixJ family response regulator
MELPDVSTAHLQKIGIALLDHQAMVREGVNALLKSVPGVEVLCSTAGCDEALELLNGDVPDVLVIEADLDKHDGLAVARLFRSLWAKVRVVLLMSEPRDGLIGRAMNDDVDAIITKHDSFDTLRCAIDAAVAGKRFYSEAISCRLTSIRSRREGDSCTLGALLSKREHEVLAHLAGGSSVKLTAERLGLAANTVDNHKARLMRKLHIHTVVELTRYAVREGLVSP